MTVADDGFLVSPRSSRLPMNVWLYPRGARHGPPCVKLEMATVSIDGDVVEGELSAADLAAVRRYLVRNRAAILDHWNEKTDGIELARALRSL